MNTTAKAKLLALVDRLIGEGRDLGNTAMVTERQVEEYVQPFSKFKAGTDNLLTVLGPKGKHWAAALNPRGMAPHFTEQMIGTLEAIKETVFDDFLLTVEDLVFAEAFSDLLEQAEYLLSEGYFLAAGVLGRAVFEEHLRKWSASVPITFAKRPTLEDYISELARAGKLNKTEAKHARWIAGVGNDAAHNSSDLKREHVEQMLPAVGTFLAQHAIA